MNILAGRSAKERLWLMLGAAATILLLVIGYVFFIGPQRASTASVDADAAQVQLQNTTLESHITDLQAESKRMHAYRAKLAAAQQALPSTSGVPDFLRTLQAIGSKTDTDVADLTVGSPADVSDVAAGVSTETAAPTTGATSEAATTAPTAAAAPTGSVYDLTITAQVNGSPDSLNGFLKQLQAVQPRAVLITSITEGTSAATTAQTTAGATSLQLTMQAFVAPGSDSSSVPTAVPTAEPTTAG